MTIDFTQVAANGRVPRSLTEVRRRGTTGVEPKRICVIALRLAAGTAAADTLFEVFGESDGFAYAGLGSQAGEICYAVRRVNKFAVVHGVGLDDSGGTAATSSLGLSGTATAAGSERWLIGGRPYVLTYAVGSTAAAQLTALKAAVDADGRRQMLTGTIASSAIPLTARQTGTSGNYLVVKRTTPAIPGITYVFTQPSGGATDPAVANAIASLTLDYDSIILGLNDATSLGAFETEGTRRYAAGVEMDGLFLAGVHGNLSAQTTFAGGHNSQHLVPFASGLSPTPPWIWMGQVAAAEALMTESDGGAIVIDVALPDCIPPDVADRFTPDEREVLLAAGMSTYYVGADEVAYVENLVTSYTTDTLGQADESFAEVRGARIDREYRANWRRYTTRFRSFKAVNADTPINLGVKALTDVYLKSEMDSFYEAYAGTGNVDDVPKFLAESRAERSGKNRFNTFHSITRGGRVVVLASLLEIG